MMKQDHLRMLCLLLVFFALLVSDVDGRTGHRAAHYNYGSYSGVPGLASSYGGLFLGIVSVILGMAICMLYLPPRLQINHT